MVRAALKVIKASDRIIQVARRGDEYEAEFIARAFVLVDKTEKVVASANTDADNLTSGHMRNFMECIRSRKQTNAPVEADTILDRYYHDECCCQNRC